MNLQGVLYLLKLALTGDLRTVAYRARMKLRGIDLRSVTITQLGLPPERCEQHANSGGPHLDVVCKTVSITPADSVLDLGCGKGGAILTMVKYPFRRVDGVEISPQMARIARENCRRMGISNSEVFVADAADFTLYDPYTFIYLYNPFPARVMEQVLANLVLSVARAPRSVTLIYNNPVCDPLVRECGFVLQREFRNATLPVRVYGLSRTPQPH